MTRIRIVVEGGVVTTVYASTGADPNEDVDVEVLDFDGDFEEENREEVDALDEDPSWRTVY